MNVENSVKIHPTRDHITHAKSREEKGPAQAMAATSQQRACPPALPAVLGFLLALSAATALSSDDDLNTPQTIRKYGYPAEAHTVQTADGYLLTIHRIPGPKHSVPSDSVSTTTQGFTSSDPTTANTPTWTTSYSAASENNTLQTWTTTPQEVVSRNGTPEPANVTTSWTTVETGNMSNPWMTTVETDVTNGTGNMFRKTSYFPGTEETPSPKVSTFRTSHDTTNTTKNIVSIPSPSTTTAVPPETTTPPNTTTAPTTTPTTPATTTVTPATTTTTSPPHQPRPVMFLQHGLLGSSYDWVVAGPEKSLAFLLADAGYDVWLGNARGNTYSRAHVYLPIEPSSPFWEFSFHEMGIYDLPAEIDYVLNVTESAQLHYVGHSMGTTMFFVMASLKPEAAAGVASMHALAPVVFVKHIKSPIRLLAPFANDVEFLIRLLGEGEFLPQNKILHYLAKYGCELLETEKEVCENLIFILCGYDKPQFDLNLLPALLSHTPAGASTRTLIHYAQMIKSGKFQQYDFGKYGNLKKYGSLEPPQYDLAKVNVSIDLNYASNDWLASITDVGALIGSLTCTTTKYLVPLPSFNHLDFILAKDVKKLVYDRLLREIPRYFDYQNYEDNFLYE